MMKVSVPEDVARAKDLVGRAWLLDEVVDRMEHGATRYFFVTGEPAQARQRQRYSFVRHLLLSMSGVKEIKHWFFFSWIFVPTISRTGLSRLAASRQAGRRATQGGPSGVSKISKPINTLMPNRTNPCVQGLT
jgi:hypothetical protein